MIRVFGQIAYVSGEGISGAMIELRALKSSTEVLCGSVLTYKCDASGHYDFPVAMGTYDVYAQNDVCSDMDYLGTAVVTADTDDGDLHHILVDGGITITPPMLDAAMEFARQAEIAATSAKSDRIQTGNDVIVTGQNKQVAETKAQESATSANEAKAARDSIVNDAADVRDKALQVADNAASVDSNTARVQRNAEQVAQNTQTVTTKTQQVSENAQSVAADTQAVSQKHDEVVAKTRIVQAAADTATQKAASAAEHDAAAAEYARQAQEAAQVTAGALIDGGAADLSAGVYPQPVQVSGVARPTFWKVTNGGTVGGVDYGVGDTLIYTVAGSGSYYKIDNTESVTSVQGEKGAVTLTPEKIGAEPVGTSAAQLQQHLLSSDPHSQYAQRDDVEIKGAVSAGIAEHEAKISAHHADQIVGLVEALSEKETIGTASEMVQSHAVAERAHSINGIAELQEVLDSKYSPSNPPAVNMSFNAIFTCYNGWYVDDVESIGIEFPTHYVFQLIFRHPSGAPSGELGVFNRNVSCSYIPYFASNAVVHYLERILPGSDNRLFAPSSYLDGQYWLMLTLFLLKV